MIDTIQVWMVFELLLSLAVWPFLVGVFLIVGSWQRRAGQGSLRRMFWSAIGAATLASLPLLIWLVVLLPPYSVETSWWFSAGLTGLSAFWVAWNLWRLMGGPLTAVPVDMSSESNKWLQRNLQRMAERIGTEISMPDLYTLTTESGVLLPGELHFDSRGGRHVYLPRAGASDSQSREETGFHMVVAMAPGECWWQLAVLPFAAVCTCLSSAFTGQVESAAVGMVAFVAAKWGVNWMFQQERREKPVFFVVWRF